MASFPREPGTMRFSPVILVLGPLLMLAVPRSLTAGAAVGVDRPLVTLSVVDDQTGEPIERFAVLPGVPTSVTADRAVANWAPHLVRESMKGRYEWPEGHFYEIFRLRIEADGYRPEMTGWLRSADGPRELTIRLHRDPGIEGVALRADGSPAAGATLGIALTNRTIRLVGRSIEHAGDPPAENPGDRWQQPFVVRADANGRFKLPTETDPAAVLVAVHEAGYLAMPFAEILGDDPTKPRPATALRLAPWGRITGRVLWGDRPGADEEIELIVSREILYPDMVSSFSTVRSDEQGRFEFPNIPPGRVQLSRLVPASGDKDAMRYQFPVTHLDVRAGGATEAVLGGKGRVVVGRLTGLDSYEGMTARVHPTAPHFGLPGDDDLWRGWAALRKSPLGEMVFRDEIPVGKDGTFRIEGLIPESYQIIIRDRAGKARGGTKFEVEPAANDTEETPVEIRAAQPPR